MQTVERASEDMNRSIQRESFGELLGELANNSAALVRDEIALAKQEMREKVTVLSSGAITIVIGGLLGLVALLTLAAAAVAAARRRRYAPHQHVGYATGIEQPDHFVKYFVKGCVIRFDESRHSSSSTIRLMSNSKVSQSLCQ